MGAFSELTNSSLLKEIVIEGKLSKEIYEVK